jgi:hypothetical protein
MILVDDCSVADTVGHVGDVLGFVRSGLGVGFERVEQEIATALPHSFLLAREEKTGKVVFYEES